MTKMKLKLTITFVAALGLCSAAQAADWFSENFDAVTGVGANGKDVGANLEFYQDMTAMVANGDVTFASGLLDATGKQANLHSYGGSTGVGGTHYLRTLDADYNDVDFIAEVLFSRNSSDGSGVMFFGMGPGTNLGGYGEADDKMVSLKMSTANGSEIAVVSNYRNWSYALGDSYIKNPAPANALATVMFARMTWTALTEEVRFEVDEGNDGSFEYDKTLDASVYVGTNTASSIFFGGRDTSWDNFTVSAVIPEPATLGLLLVGGVATVLRRRRK